MTTHTCAACGATMMPEDIAHNPETELFTVRCPATWGKVTAVLTVSVTTQRSFELCAACARAAIRSGYETMAVTLPVHVWDEGEPQSDRESPVFLSDDSPLYDADEEEDDVCIS